MTYKPHPIKQLFHNARRQLARLWLSKQPGLQIAITGSQGKTNTSYIISQVLSKFGKTLATDINLDTIYNVPITALKTNSSFKFIIFEVGIDRPGEMDLHLEIVRPKIAVITGISPVHTDQEHLGSLENLIREKQKLIAALPESGYAILNYDDANVRMMAKYTKAKVIYYGLDEKADYCAKNIKTSLAGTEFQIEGKTIATPLIGAHQVYNLLAAYAVFKIVEPQAKKEKYIQIVKNIQPLKGRMNVEPGPLGTTLLNDSLRANPTSTKSGLETLSALNYQKGKKIAILAEMGELQNPEKEHEKIGDLINNLKIDVVICIGPLQKFVYQKIKDNPRIKAYFVTNVFEAAEILKTLIQKNDLLYLKGSLLRHVERVLLLLEGQTVNCQKIVCSNYNHCSQCPQLI